LSGSLEFSGIYASFLLRGRGFKRTVRAQVAKGDIAFAVFQERSREMGKALTKSQVVAGVAEKAGISKAQTKAAIEALVSMAYKGAADGFTIPGLGKLVKVRRKARMGRNPATGEAIKIPAKTALKFRVAKAAKDAVLGSK
jgi:DNA-binding protein HU-beta